MYKKLLPPALSLAVLSGLLLVGAPATSAVDTADAAPQTTRTFSQLNVKTASFMPNVITADSTVKISFASPAVSSTPKPKPKPVVVVTDQKKTQNATEDITSSGDTSIEGMQNSAQRTYLATAGIEPIVQAPSPASPALAKVVAAAKEGLGVPYVWGGTSRTTGWDCSGFVQWAYAQAGIQLPRTFQWVGTQKISKEEAKPGDIVVQNSGTHIGIYAGNGMMWSALNPSVGTLEHSTDIMNADFYRVVTK